MAGVSAPTVARVLLVLFVLAWLLGPSAVRRTFPLWFVFLLAAGLELHFLIGARRARPRLPDRAPQAVDRERYGTPQEEEAADGDDVLDDEGEREGDWEEWDEWEDEPEPAVRRRWLPARRVGITLLALAGALVAAWLWDSRSGWKGLDDETRAAVATRLSAEASLVAGKRVRIRCDDRGEHVGAVQRTEGIAIVGGTLSYLTPQRCHDLYRLAFRGEDDGSQTARALSVLAHEAWHLRGVRDEGTTECYALQSAVGLGERLGLGRGRARQLMRQQLAENALRARGSSQYLVPPECRDGGRLDLDPSDPRFP